MKKALSILALTVLFSVSANAQTGKKAVKKEKAKTEKAAASADEKKSCGSEAKACCSSKKAEAKKEE